MFRILNRVHEEGISGDCSEEMYGSLYSYYPEAGFQQLIFPESFR